MLLGEPLFLRGPLNPGPLSPPTEFALSKNLKSERKWPGVRAVLLFCLGWNDWFGHRLQASRRCVFSPSITEAAFLLSRVENTALGPLPPGPLLNQLALCSSLKSWAP